MSKARRGRALKALLALVICLVISEFSLRAIFRPPSRGKITADIIGPDPELGWSNRPGKFEIDLTETRKMSLRHWPDGTRATSEHFDDPRPKLLIAGCSYTWGGNLSDPETYPWQLQTRLRSLRVANLGSRAYSTFQGTLAVERYLKMHGDVKVVLFGFAMAQLPRNVADFEWISTLAMGAQVTYPSMPYVELDRDLRIVRKGPVPIEVSFLSRHSTQFSLLEIGWNRLVRRRYSLEQQAEVAVRLLGDMKEAARRQGARFAAVNLLKANHPAGRLVEELARRSAIEWIDCGGGKDERDHVPEVGHPSGKANSGWAECIQRGLEARRWIGPGS